MGISPVIMNKFKIPFKNHLTLEQKCGSYKEVCHFFIKSPYFQKSNFSIKDQIALFGFKYTGISNKSYLFFTQILNVCIYLYILEMITENV